MNRWVNTDHSTPRASPMTATGPSGAIGRVSVLPVVYVMEPEIKHCTYSSRLLHPASIALPFQSQIKIQLNR